MIEVKQDMVIEFDYVNWRGIAGHRNVFVKKVYYGTTEYHSKAQWLMEAYDLDKSENRIFAMADMTNVIVP